MSLGLFLLIGFGVILVAIPAMLGAKSQAKSTRLLTENGQLAEAEVLEVVLSEDVFVKFRFVLPDGRTPVVCTDVLSQIHKSLQQGDRVVVRYNPKCPAINRLEPQTSLSEKKTHANSAPAQ